MLNRPILAVTLGDPAGIGPEIVVKALSDSAAYSDARPIVVGSPAVVERARSLVPDATPIRVVDSLEDATFDHGVIDVLPAGGDVDVTMGRIQARAGAAAYGWIRAAIQLANAGRVDGVATAPIHKEALVAAKVPYIDHTAMFGDLGRRDGALLTLFVVRSLRVFFATRHSSLRDAIASLSVDGLVESLSGAASALARFGEPDAHIALAALNPHGGEDGLFGDEETRVLRPAVEQAIQQGLRVSGPYPADSVFVQAARGRFDAVMSLYHDQGHIAAKMHDFERTVAITTGLAFVRSSVDHGTAFDIAGKGIADATSMTEAIRVGAEYIRRARGAR